MWWFLVLLGVLIALSGLSVIGLGVSIFVSTFGNTLITTGAVAASGGFVITAMGLVLRQLERLTRQVEASLERNGAAGWQGPDEDETPPLRDAAPPAEPQVGLVKPEPVKPASTAPIHLSERDLLPPEPEIGEEPSAEPATPPQDPMVAARRAHLEHQQDREPERPGALEPQFEREPAPAPPAVPPMPPLPRARTGYEPPRPPRPAPPPIAASSPIAPAVEPEAPADEPRILKSGIVGGMAYTLYSDGSIQAELPDGVVRFASLQELRDHVAQTHQLR